jgi:hypothetical protein
VNAFQDLDAFHYNQSFSKTSFSFEPATSARSRYGGILLNWDKTKEEDYFNNVIKNLQPSLKVTLVFTPMTSTNFPDSCEIGIAYHLNVPHTKVNVAKAFTGQSQFTFIRDPQDEYWYISRWVDVGVNSSDSTWSDLKGAFAQ